MEVTSSNLVPPTANMINTIQITFPDETTKEMEKGSTSADVARSIGEGLYRSSIAAKVNGDMVDMNLPINTDTRVEIITSKNPEAQDILLHSSAHLMAQAIKVLYPSFFVNFFALIESDFI